MKKIARYLPFLICSIIFIAYSVLSVVRHEQYQSFGFDLGLRDQVVWKYSQFQEPITTVHFYPFHSILADHVELIYLPISLFYWLWSSPLILCLIEALYVCFSGLAIFLLAREKKLKFSVSLALLFSYLTFYGLQNAVWFDVHSASFITGSLAWFIYALETKKLRVAIIFFILTIVSKENAASLTFLVSLVYLIQTRRRVALGFMIASIVYLAFIFGVYYPYLTQDGYRYQNNEGLLSNITNISSFADTAEKRQVIVYSLAAFGFLPLLNPLYIIPAAGDLFSYFVIASDLKAAHGLFMHYRITLTPLLLWATIMAIVKYPRLNMRGIAIYLLGMALLFQYFLHLPLSYLSKQWFWHKPESVININTIIGYLPKNASVVSQNNITPHISQRDQIFTLWPENKSFKKDSPCGNPSCNWFRWAGEPEYLIVDTSTDWDARHFLTDREAFIEGIRNLEKAQVITKHKQKGETVLYKILKKP